MERSFTVTSWKVGASVTVALSCARSPRFKRSVNDPPSDVASELWDTVSVTSVTLAVSFTRSGLVSTQPTRMDETATVAPTAHEIVSLRQWSGFDRVRLLITAFERHTSRATTQGVGRASMRAFATQVGHGMVSFDS